MQRAVSPRVAELDVKGAALLERPPDGRLQRLAILRMDQLDEGIEGAPEFLGRNAVDGTEVFGPTQLVGADVPVPNAHFPGIQGHAKALFALPQRFQRAHLRADVLVNQNDFANGSVFAAERIGDRRHPALGLRMLAKTRHRFLRIVLDGRKLRGFAGEGATQQWRDPLRFQLWVAQNVVLQDRLPIDAPQFLPGAVDADRLTVRREDLNT